MSRHHRRRVPPAPAPARPAGAEADVCEVCGHARLCWPVELSGHVHWLCAECLPRVRPQ